jgi:hypothetical protein
MSTVCIQRSIPVVHETSKKWQDVPVFIINRNNFERGFIRQLDWLRNVGMNNITVIDNDSTYPPLLDFYSKRTVSVLKSKSNAGPWTFWQKGMYKGMNRRYVVSDADLVPAPGCPDNLVEKMMEVFDRYYPNCHKVGPGIRIDNLPDHYEKKEAVLKHESCHFEKLMPEGDAYRASIDTTFALYEAMEDFASPRDPDHYHYRLATPYVVEHVPWYENSAIPNDELKFYKENSNRMYLGNGVEVTIHFNHW